MQAKVSFITDIFILRKLYSRILCYVYTAMDQKYTIFILV